MSDDISTSRCTLDVGEPHPSSHSALSWISRLGMQQLAMAQESYSSCAIEGNRHAEICSETLRRLMNSEPVSDRYLLGLAWSLREMFGEDR